MKKLFLLTLAGVLFFSCGDSDKSDSKKSDAKDKSTVDTEVSDVSDSPGTSDRKLYSIESGYVKFINHAVGQEMIRELWFDQYGNRQYEENYMNMFGEKVGGKSLVIDGFRYNWDYDSQTGNKMKFYQAVSDYDNISERDIARYGIVKHGNEDILGKSCQKISTEEPVKSTVWMWNNIALKTEAEFGGEPVIMEAVEIIEGPVDASLLEIPDDISFTEMN
ncbi:MAG: hypothetical protein JW801_05025 [Bacteroidales bacterium]|nr:hypothetical protein [Bacteroidales bacterium]